MRIVTRVASRCRYIGRNERRTRQQSLRHLVARQGPANELAPPHHCWISIEAAAFGGAPDPKAHQEAHNRALDTILVVLTAVMSKPLRRRAHRCLAAKMLRGFPYGFLASSSPIGIDDLMSFMIAGPCCDHSSYKRSPTKWSAQVLPATHLQSCWQAIAASHFRRVMRGRHDKSQHIVEDFEQSLQMPC